MAKKKAIVKNVVEEVIKDPEDTKPVVNTEVMQALGMRLKNKFIHWKKLRKQKEIEWIESMRQHKGIYDPETLAKLDPKSSKVYPKITRSKDVLVLSKLHEMLFSADRNWGVEPTPVPKVSKAVAQQIALSLVRVDPQTNTPILPNKEDIDKAISEYSKLACDSMQKEMDDQLVEMKYNVKIGKPVLRSGVILGTGVAKGPLIEKATRREWNLNKKAIDFKDIELDTPFYQFIRVWDWYPDMTVTDPEDMEGSFERHSYSKHQLRKLMKLQGFDANAISEYIVSKPKGDYIPEQWEQDVRELSKESGAGTSRTDSGDYIDMGSGTGGDFQGIKYEVLEYWGYIDAADLEACGASISEDERDDEIKANVWLLGGVPIKAIPNPNPGKKDMYKTFYYEKDETSIFGEGLPRAIRHSQLAICAAARMILNNGAICGGPQFEINWDLVDTDTTDPSDIHPMKVWVRHGMGAESQYPAVRVYNVESHIGEYINIINQFLQFGDIEATLPTWMISEPMKSGNETVGAVSMKMGTINISLRDIVRNFDDFTENVIDSLYMWNMEFNPKKEIKGDYKVRARGSTSIIMKEVRMNSLNMFATTMQPEDWAYVPRLQFLEARVKTNDLDIELRSEEDAQAYMQSQVDMRAKELAYQQMEADIQKTQAMALNMATKSKKTNVEAGATLAGEAGKNVGK